MANPFRDVIIRLERQKASIDRALAALREVEDTDEVTPKTQTKPKGKHKISDEGRKRMAEAQQKRWAAKRAAETGAMKKSTRKGTKKKASAKEE